MSAQPSRGIIDNAISCRVAYPAATDLDVPGVEGSSPGDIVTYDEASLGFRVLVASTGNRYTKTSMTLYAAGGRITQEDAGGGAVGVDGTFTGLAGLEAGRVVYLTATGTVAYADASNNTLAPPFGIITAVVTATTYTVRRTGEVTNPRLALGADMVAGTDYYLSEVAGEIIAVAPATAGALTWYLGRAKTTTVLELSGTSSGAGATEYLANGTPGAPSLALFASPTSGFYRAAADTIGIAIAGVAAGAMSASGLTYIVNDAFNTSSSPIASIAHTTSGVPAAGIGAAIEFIAEVQAGTSIRAGYISGSFSSVGAGTETGQIDLIPVRAGADIATTAGLRVSGLLDIAVNGLNVRPITAAAALATGIILTPYGDSADVSIDLASRGTGNLLLSLAGAGTINLNAGATGSVQIGNHANALVGLYAVAPVARAGAIAAPSVPGVGYVQAEAQSAVDAINAIRVALTNIGVTL